MINSTGKLYVVKTSIFHDSTSFIITDKKNYVTLKIDNDTCVFSWGETDANIMKEVLKEGSSELFRRMTRSFYRGELVGDSIYIIEGQNYYSPDDLMFFRVLKMRFFSPITSELVRGSRGKTDQWVIGEAK